MTIIISSGYTIGPGVTLISSSSILPNYPGYAYSYRYWKFEVTEIANPSTENNEIWQIGGFTMYYRDQPLSYSSASASMPSGAVYNPAEGPSNAIDNNPATKLCVQGSDGASSGMSGLGWPLIIDMGHPCTAQSFSYTTANDSAGVRDPVCWIVWGSSDGTNWSPVQWTQGYTPTLSRETETDIFLFNPPFNTHIQVPTITGGLVSDNAYTAWTGLNANNVDSIPVGALALGNNTNNLIGGIYTVTNVLANDGGYSKVTVQGRPNSTEFNVTEVGSNLPFDVYFTSTIVTSGLLLHLDSRNATSWPGSGTTWYDLSGNNNNATFYSNASESIVGGGPVPVEGTAIDGSTLMNNGDIYFNGTSGAAQYQYAAGPNLSSNLLTWTINCWFKANSLVPTSELPAIFSGIYTGYTGTPYGDSVNFELGFYNGSGNDDNLYGGFYQQGSWEIVPTGEAITPGIWYNGVVTYDGSTISFYINNTLVSSRTGVYSTSLVSGLGYHVSRRWDTADTFDGYVPVVMAYNRALTTDELTQNFQSYRSQYGV